MKKERIFRSIAMTEDEKQTSKKTGYLIGCFTWFVIFGLIFFFSSLLWKYLSNESAPKWLIVVSGIVGIGITMIILKKTDTGA
jgi:uncharacterized BrkB/YihY/UPF0761 family membrane protein